LHARGIQRTSEIVGSLVEVRGIAEPGIVCHQADIFIACESGDAERLKLSHRLAGNNSFLLADDVKHVKDEVAGFEPLQPSQGAEEIWTQLRKRLVEAEEHYHSTWRSRARGLGYRVLKTPEFKNKRVCLFSHFDVDGKLDPHVRLYLQALSHAGVETWLITSNDGLDPESLESARAICGAVIARENRGYDFAGWAMALDVWPELFEADELIFANDSVYGPMVPLESVFAKMKSSCADVWAMTESREIVAHLQSYFLVFRRSALAHSAVRRFWRDVRPLPSKHDVISRYEVSLGGFVRAAGLRTAAYASLPDNSTSNPTSKHWRSLLSKSSFPFIKVSLLRDNPLGDDITGWEHEVSRGGYPASLIQDHLRRVKPAAAALRTVKLDR
jgi:hypothetical protein